MSMCACTGYPGSGASGLTDSGIDPGSAGFTTVTRPSRPSLASRPASRQYSDLTGSMTSQGSPARVSCTSRCRTVCDFPAPVAPVTSACRFSVGSGTRKSPAGWSRASRMVPRHSGSPAGRSAGSARASVSLVRSK